MDRILDRNVLNIVVTLLADGCFLLLYKMCKFTTSSCKPGQFIEKDSFIERDEETKIRSHSLRMPVLHFLCNVCRDTCKNFNTGICVTAASLLRGIIKILFSSYWRTLRPEEPWNRKLFSVKLKKRW